MFKGKASYVWFILFLITAAALAFEILLHKPQAIIFAQKIFFAEEGLVWVHGTLTGDHLPMPYPNNTHLIECLSDQKACTDYSLEQIGYGQMGPITNEFSFEVQKWDPYEIVATEISLAKCFKRTLIIDLKSEAAIIVQEPINQTMTECKNSDSEIRKWTIEDPPEWKRIYGALKN